MAIMSTPNYVTVLHNNERLGGIIQGFYRRLINCNIHCSPPGEMEQYRYSALSTHIPPSYPIDEMNYTF